MFDVPYLNLEYWFYQIYTFLKDIFDADPTTGTSVSVFTNVLTSIAYIFIILSMTVIAYCTIRLFEIRKKEHEHIHHEIHEYAHHHNESMNKKEKVEFRNKRWVTVLEYLEGDNESEWKLAILEADTILDDLMMDLKFPGENLGDRLKNADREKFKNLTIAWEVHTIRNRIAHEGSDFNISHREAKRVIALYEIIFREFGYI